MVIIEKNSLNDIPFLHIVKQTEHQRKLPLILFVHGFTSAKETNLHYAYLLAEKGYRVVLPEAIFHGERGQGLNEKEFYTHFWEIVIKTIHELEVFKEYYIAEDLADRDRIGVAGTSMGGIVTLGALTQFKWIKTAVSLMGMPSYEKFSLWQLNQLQQLGFKLPFTVDQLEEQLSILRQYDLSQQPERIGDRPLLFWHGKKDPTVPYDLTYEFYQSVTERYPSASEYIKFITDENADHKVSREGQKAMVEWFERYL